MSLDVIHPMNPPATQQIKITIRNCQNSNQFTPLIPVQQPAMVQNDIIPHAIDNSSNL